MTGMAMANALPRGHGPQIRRRTRRIAQRRAGCLVVSDKTVRCGSKGSSTGSFGVRARPSRTPPGASSEIVGGPERLPPKSVEPDQLPRTDDRILRESSSEMLCAKRTVGIFARGGTGETGARRRFVMFVMRRRRGSGPGCASQIRHRQYCLGRGAGAFREMNATGKKRKEEEEVDGYEKQSTSARCEQRRGIR